MAAGPTAAHDLTEDTVSASLLETSLAASEGLVGIQQPAALQLGPGVVSCTAVHPTHVPHMAGGTPGFSSHSQDLKAKPYSTLRFSTQLPYGICWSATSGRQLWALPHCQRGRPGGTAPLLRDNPHNNSLCCFLCAMWGFCFHPAAVRRKSRILCLSPAQGSHPGASSAPREQNQPTSTLAPAPSRWAGAAHSRVSQGKKLWKILVLFNSEYPVRSKVVGYCLDTSPPALLLPVRGCLHGEQLPGSSSGCRL